MATEYPFRPGASSYLGGSRQGIAIVPGHPGGRILGKNRDEMTITKSVMAIDLSLRGPSEFSVAYPESSNAATISAAVAPKFRRST